MGGFRFLLASAVMLGHLGFYGHGVPHLVNGDIAVNAFYVVSGFLITLVLFEKYEPGRRGTLLFYSNRALRIYPIYWGVLVLFVIANVFVVQNSLPVISYPDVTRDYVSAHSGLATVQNASALNIWIAKGRELGPVSSAILFLSNLFLFGQDALIFFSRDDAGHIHWIPRNLTFFFHFFVFLRVAWSIGVELSFYVLAPFIVRRLRVVMGVMLGSLVVQVVLHNCGYAEGSYYYQFLPVALAYFMFGSLAYRIYRWLRREDIGSGNRPMRQIWSWGSCLALVALTIWYPELPQVSLGGHLPVLKPVLYLAAVALLLPGMVWLLRENRVDDFLGSLSYPIYLVHTLFVVVVVGGPELFGLPKGPVVVVIVLALSVLITVFIEQPLDRFRQSRIAGKHRAVQALA